eukprot:TRINITY_DN111817_c0_g1_i1.p1 TRINITY_DN111817_c0_g1~~TRINITY_DN111817_c0_g1_i1.p1  ORF type:complete len:691 (-),score=88.49 TRINITY_DN111817_c0_g1_i1:85-2031(-)
MSLLLGLLLVCLRLQGAASHGHYMPGAKGPAAILREVMGGSDVRDFLQRWFLGRIPDIDIASRGPITVTADGMYEQTYLSPPLKLGPGEVGNKWMAIEWPHGHVAVKGFTADVVKAGPDGQAPPITPCCGGDHVAAKEEVFMHHWTVNKWQLPATIFERLVAMQGQDYNVESDMLQSLEVLMADAGLNTGADGPCIDGEMHLYFGVGNEARGKHEGRQTFEFPDPYGVVFNSDDMASNGEFMVLNTHLIDVRGVEDVRGCTECKCATQGISPKKELEDIGYVGGLSCCHSTEADGGKCPSAAASRMPETYYIRYTMRWREWSPDTLPLEVISLDATDNNTQWSDLSALAGGFHEAHELQKSDPTSMKSLYDHRSGAHLGMKKDNPMDMLVKNAACHIEYYVPSCRPGVDKCMHEIRNSWTMPYPIDIVFVRNHLHEGGQRMSTWTDKHTVCAGTAVYETQGGMSWLQSVTPCKLGTSALPQVVRVERGEEIKVEAVYSQDDEPHYGVMAMSFIYAHIPGARDAARRGPPKWLAHLPALLGGEREAPHSSSTIHELLGLSEQAPGERTWVHKFPGGTRLRQSTSSSLDGARLGDSQALCAVAGVLFLAGALLALVALRWPRQLASPGANPASSAEWPHTDDSGTEVAVE